MLRLDEVLGAASREFPVGVDEQDTVILTCRQTVRAPQHQDAGRDSSAIEDIRPHSDDRLQAAVLDDLLSDLLLLASPEEHAVWHDRGCSAVRLEHSQDVLDEHQVGFLARLGGPSIGHALRVSHAPALVVLGEGRVGEDAVETAQLTTVVLVARRGEGVAVDDATACDAVENHVHPGHRPGAAILLLAIGRNRGCIMTVFLDVLLREDQHATRAAARIVDRLAFLRIDEADHHPDHRARGVELAALLAPSSANSPIRYS